MDTPIKRHSLRGRVILIIAACFIVLLVLFASIFFPSMFGMIHMAEDSVLRSLQIVAGENIAARKAAIRHISLAYANWDQSVSFVLGKNPRYISDNWPSGIIAHEYDLNFTAFADSGGTIVYREFLDYLNPDGPPMPEPPGFQELVSRLYQEVLAKYDRTSTDFNSLAAEEILFLGEKPFYVCAAPVAVYNVDGRPFGVFVTGILLTDEYMRTIIHFPRTTFTLLNGAQSAKKVPNEIERPSNQEISLNMPVENPGGGILILQATRQRESFRAGSQVVMLTSLGLCAAMGGIFIVLSFFFHRGVLRPIFLLNREVTHIRGTEALQMRGYGRQSEIYSLAAAINDMLQHLTDKEEAEARLVRRIEQQELMRNLSQIFASGSTTRTNIENSLAKVGDFLKADRVIIAHIDTENRRVEYPYVWHGDKKACGRIEPGVFNPQDALYRDISEGRQARIAVDDTSATAYRISRADTAVKAFVSVPIQVSGGLWGILTIEVFDVPRHWSESDLQLIGLIQNELSNDIAKSIIKDNLIRTSAIVENTPRFVMFMNGGGRIEYVNAAVTCDTGYSEEEFMQGGLALLAAKEDMARINEVYLPQVLKEGKSDFTMMAVRKNGEEIIMAVTAFALTLQDGEIAIALTANDVTELYVLQKELIAAKEHAEYYNRAKSDFISRMSHEMRTPMNAIIGMAGIGQTEDGTQQKNYCLEKIDHSARDLLDIINNMLDMVKFEHKTSELAPQVFDLYDMLQATVGLFKVRAREKKQGFTLDVAQDLPRMVFADQNALKHVLINILGNAVKFTPEGGSVGLSAALAAREGDTAVLRFAVSDTGIGIQKEHLEHLGEAFEQQESGITRRYGGVGLGLTIAKNIVRMMDGDIQVESEPGKGSVFTCTLKVGIPAEGEQGAAEEAASDEEPFAGRRFLLADDIELNREIVLALLDGSGAAIDCAADGGDAVEKFTARSGGYDLLLMDLHMPGMDGFEAARRIRASGLPGARSVPIIAITADTGGEVVTKCLNAGMNAHIGKPVDLDELMKTIARHLPKKAAPVGA
ncbi:MAG: response regulator [Spirochaetia bacterium]|jgi:PAS domain S-box-containing protein|nr:response regulator [Spirochaetia bacterium]